MSLIALIPARRGSKRVTNKNMAILAGKPLIQYTIEQAIESAIFNEIVVSTDWDDCSDLAQELYVNVAHRPPSLAQDDSHDYEWVTHALSTCIPYDDFMILRPTSPFRSVRSILSAWLKFSETPCDSLRAITKTAHHPCKSWILEGDHIVPLAPMMIDSTPFFDLPTQLLPTIYCQTGSFQIAHTSNLTTFHNVSGNRIIPFFMEGRETIDINTPSDLDYAEYLMTRLTQ